MNSRTCGFGRDTSHLRSLLLITFTMVRRSDATEVAIVRDVPYGEQRDVVKGLVRLFPTIEYELHARSRQQQVSAIQ